MDTNTIIILLAVLSALIGYITYSYFVQKKAFTLLNSEEFAKVMRKGQVIDVREPAEFCAGHILGARNISVGQIRGFAKNMPKENPLYLYCQSQARSQRAALLLYKEGFTSLYVLQGGFRKWTGKIKS